MSTADEGEPDDLFKKITIEVKTHDPAVLSSYEKFVKMAADELDIKVESMQVDVLYLSTIPLRVRYTYK